MMVFIRYLFSNMAILGTYVKFQGGMHKPKFSGYFLPTKLLRYKVVDLTGEKIGIIGIWDLVSGRSLAAPWLI